jgi:CheY-like chemotaxis protein
MPIMGGFEACQKIRNAKQENFMSLLNIGNMKFKNHSKDEES